MTSQIKEFFLNPADLQFVYEQATFRTLKVVGYTADGTPIYGYVEGRNSFVPALLTAAEIGAGTTTVGGNTIHILGAISNFDPLDPEFSLYNGARDFQGLRNVSGDLNNLIDGQGHWGATGSEFMRLVNADYTHYLQENIDPNLAALSAANTPPVLSFGPNINSTSSSISSESPHATGTINVGPVSIPYEEWTQTVEQKDTTTSIAYGHHSFVNEVKTTTTVSTQQLDVVQIGGSTYATVIDPGTPGTPTTTQTLTGGELDTTTIIGGHLAHDFHGVTNGVTAPADYSDTTASVVDYTPRMITQTISSHDALDKLGIATDVQTGVLSDNTPYTETFIENTNSYAADPSYSGWFVLFGQFFDHGLDFVEKPGGGPTIQVALAVDDPLYGAIGPDGKPTTSITINRATPETLVDKNGNHVLVGAMAGPDGKFGTGNELLSLGVDGVLGGGDDVIGKADAQYVNHTSPYIDQSQSYGSADGITLLLREWVEDPNNPGHYIPGANLLDGQTVKNAYLSTVFTDQSAGTFNADGQGLTNRTLPTLNELRAHLIATGRDDLTWEDVSDYRERDANGHVIDTDNATGIQSISSGEPLLLDMNPHFDLGLGTGHIDTSTTGKLAALGATNITTGPGGDIVFTYNGNTTSLFANFDFVTSSITAADPGVHAAIGEILLQSVGDHYIAGDGRANENFGLTTVHHVFHEDHNVQLVNLESTILAGQDVDPVKAHNWQVKVASTNPISFNSTSDHGSVATSNSSYTGATYDYSALHYDSGVGSYVADITNVRDARGNIIMDSTGSTVLTVHNVYTDSSGHVSWNQDMMFNATKLMVEMEYQHVAIDQYARFVTPDLPEFVTYDANINANISLEYAQAAFRFGHSQLRETIDAIETQGADGSFDVTGAITHYALSAAFLNPGEFADVGPGAIALGMTHQVGNETDEFLAPAMQQSLLGQPLDLGAINIARGRDLGIPTLNEVRQQLYDALVAERANTNGPASAAHAKIQLDLLKPYNSWNEFGNSMIHSESLVNYIAAYSFDGDVAHAQAVIDADASGSDVSYVGSDGMPDTVTAQDAAAFMSGTLDPNNPTQFKVAGAGGFNSIDLWIGGLAESHVLGGILGPTFNAIFEDQMERLMDGDRFYYLYRLFNALPQITNLSGQITNEQFKDIVERTTGVQHLNGDIMLYADSYVELGQTATADMKTEHKYGGILEAFATAHTNTDGTKQGIYSSGGIGTGGNGGLITILNPEYSADPANVHAHSLPQFLTFINDVRPDSPDINSNGNPTYGYNSHEVLSGTDYNDYLDTGDGDDTSYGGKGNDVLVGNGGSDHLYGQEGDDILYGAGGTAGADVADFLDGGDGNDYIYGGQNAGATEVLIGGRGNDHIYGESGIDEIYGDEGDDYIDAGGDTDLAFGGGGNDELYGGEGPDELHGEAGDDLISAGSGSDVLVGEQGDDILFGGQGGGVAQGDSDELIGGSLGGDDFGFDLADYSDSSIKLDLAADLNNQNLQGTPNGVGFEPFNHLYTGIDGLVGSKYDDKVAPVPTDATNRNNPGGAGLIGDDNANWLIGGSGNDNMEARGGNDVVVGGSIKLADLNAFLATQNTPNTTPFAQHFLDLQASRPDFLLGDGGTDGTSDTTVTTGNFADYSIVALDALGQVIANPHSVWSTVRAIKVTDNVDSRTLADGITVIPGDGTDVLIGVENIKFADQLLNIQAYFDKPPALDLNYVLGSVPVASDNFSGGGNGYSRGTGWTGNWSETGDNNSATSGQILVDNAGGSNSLHITGGNGNGFNGASISRAVDLSTYQNAQLQFTVNESGLTSGQTVQVYFDADGAGGAAAVLLDTFNTSTNNAGLKTYNLAGPFTNAATLSFAASAMNSTGNDVYIDNVSVTTPGDTAAGINYTTGYTEQLAPTAITVSPLITDPDDAVMASAKVVLQDAIAGDTLTAGSLPAGITSSIDTSVAGKVTLTLTGAATLSNYQAALKAVTFSSTSDNPTNAARHIDVTVNDGLKDSPVARTTVTVTPVDDTPVLAADNVITNIGTGSTSAFNIAIPDWALLANDTDPDSVLSINGLTNAVGIAISTLGAGHSGGTVTVRDTSPAGGTFQYTVPWPTHPSVAATVTVNQDTTGAIDGTGSADIIVGNSAASTIDAGAGNDIIFGGGGDDVVNGGANTDTAGFTGNAVQATFGLSNAGVTVNTGASNTDTLTSIEKLAFDDGIYTLAAGTDNADPALAGTDGNDILLGFGGSDVLTGGAGNDFLAGGAGNDSLDGGAGTDTAMFTGASTEYQYSLNALNQLVVADTIANRDGTDAITGVENLRLSNATYALLAGTAAADALTSFQAPQILIGGAGGDAFIFNSTATAGNSATTRDMIVDFVTIAANAATHDILNLSGIDASTNQGGNQTFIWDAAEVTSDNHARGHVGYHYVTVGGVQHTIISGNTSSNTSSHNFQIDLVGHLALTTAGANADVIL